MAIEREVVIEAPVDVVWRMVTEPEHIARWFSDAAELDARGGAGSLSWKEYGTVHLRVEKVDAPRLFSFRWVYPEGAEPRRGNSILVEFTLSSEGGGTRLRVAETGLEASDWTDEAKATYVDDHRRGWQQHFGDLVSYVTGQGAELARP